MKYFRLSTGGFDFYENISKNIIIVHSPSSTIDLHKKWENSAILKKVDETRVVARFRFHLNQTWFLKFIRLTFGHINSAFEDKLCDFPKLHIYF